MSGPVEPMDTIADFGVSAIEVREGRTARVGSTKVARVLPTKGRRTIGPWCFVDLMSADEIDRPAPLEIGPHPHIGLATVTWLFSGEVLHSDSLGTEQPIRPGELNLMTAGRGIAHAELGLTTPPANATNGVMGAQMWLAQPEQTRHDASRFEHLDQLPGVDLRTAEARVMIGEHAGAVSPAVIDHPAVGLDIRLRAPTEIVADPAFEHGVVPIDRPVRVADVIVEPGSLALVPAGTESFPVETREGTGRLLVLGGEPLGAPVKMWWNFVARTADEITQAWRDWQAHDEDRFGHVPSSLRRIDAPAPPWVRSPD